MISRRIAVLVLLLAAVLLSLGVSIQQIFFEKPSFLGVSWTVEGMEVLEVLDLDQNGQPTPAARAGLRRGDRIVGIYDSAGRGGPIESYHDYGDRTRMMKAGEVYTLEVFRSNIDPNFLQSILSFEKTGIFEIPEGSYHKVNLKIVPGPPQGERSLNVTLTMVADWIWIPSLMIFAGTIVGFLRPRDEHAFLAGVMFLSYASLYHADLLAYPALGRDAMLMFLKTTPYLTPFLFLLFFLRFPKPSPLEKRAPWLKYLVLGFLGFLWFPYFLSEVSYFMSYEWHRAIQEVAMFRAWKEAESWMVIPGLSIVYLLGVFSVERNRQTAETPQEANRLHIILLGTMGLLGLYILIILGRLQIRIPVMPYSLITILAGTFPLLFVYAVIKHRTFGIRFIFRRGLQYALVSRGFLAVEALLIFIALFFLAGPFFTSLFPQARQSVTSVGTAVVTLALVAGLREVNRKVMPVIDRRFFRDVYDAQRILTDLSRTIRQTPSQPDLLLNNVAARILETLHPRQVTIFLHEDALPKMDPEEARLLSRLTIGHSGGEQTFIPYLSRQAGRNTVPDLDPLRSRLEETLSEQALLSRFLNRPALEETETLVIEPRFPRQQDLGDADPSSPPREQEPESILLARFQTRLVVPLVTGGKVLGFVALGEKRSEEPYSREDKELLAVVAEQVAIALDHDRLIRQLTQQEKLQRELEIAKEVQIRLFPQKWPELATLEYSGNCIQAREVGGDFYDFIDLGPGRVGLVLADIAGKGISSALMMASLEATLRRQNPSMLENIEQLLELVNRQFGQS
ncbi:MAG: GAF domain-containing protein, partial [Acidobacteriota bacterium]